MKTYIRKNGRLYSKKCIGYIVDRNGWFHTRIADKFQATKLKAVQENEMLAIELLEKRAFLYANPEYYYEKDDEKQIQSLFHAIHYFKESKYHEYSINTTTVFDRTFNYFFKENLSFEHETLFNHIVETIKKTDLNDSTLKKYLNSLQRFFDFFLKLKYINGNPILLINKPKLINYGKKIIFTDEELTAIFDIYNNNDEFFGGAIIRIEQYNAIKLLFETGMRPIELLRLKKADISDSGFFITGKTGTREFPFAPFPIVKNVINQQIALTGRREHLFKWKNIQNIERAFLKVLRKLGIRKQLNERHLDEDNKKVLYTLRATRLWKWEKEFQYNQKIIDDLAGNSFAVRKHHYRPTPSAKDLGEMILSEAKTKISV